MVAESVYVEQDYDFVLTEGTGGKHSRASLHYIGNAVDIRTNVIQVDKQRGVTDEIQARLNSDYDVVLEKDHIHLEYQPKGAVGL